MTKGSIQEDITFVTMHAPNTGAPKYIKQMFAGIKEEINSKVVVRNLDIPLTSMDRDPERKSVRKHWS